MEFDTKVKIFIIVVSLGAFVDAGLGYLLYSLGILGG